VPVKKLRYLRCFYIRITQHRRNGGACRDALAQCSGQSIFGVAGPSGGSGRFATHSLQSVTPRKLQIMQTNVPQSEQG
jgi:hypothetical protein